MLYSTALPPALIAGTQKALEIVDKEGARLVQKLLDNKRYLWERLDKHGFQVLKGEASICSLLAGSTEKTLRIYQALFDARILTTPFIYPSVAKNKGVIRMIPRIDLAESHLDHLIQILLDTRENLPELFA
ncbi:hypothetical protein MASR1M36_15580 [Candidatus Cloacimonadaceae bacterium]